MIIAYCPGMAYCWCVEFERVERVLYADELFLLQLTIREGDDEVIDFKYSEEQK
jgi:hypothetical protein